MALPLLICFLFIRPQGSTAEVVIFATCKLPYKLLYALEGKLASEHNLSVYKITEQHTATNRSLRQRNC